MQRLCYVSRANFQPVDKNIALTNILTEARNFNAKHQIQGVLYFADGYFLQCLEGSDHNLELLMTRLQKDSRHQAIYIISNQPISTPIFNDWSMKFLSRQHRIKQFFQQQGYVSFCPERLDPTQLEQLCYLLCEVEAEHLVA